MYGITYDTKVSIDTSSGDVSDSFEDRDRKSSALGVDLGAYYTPKAEPNLRFGIVGKNLNSPEFDTVTNEAYKIDPMVRAGVYYAGFDHWLDFALDFDLTANKTFLDDIDSQYIAGDRLTLVTIGPRLFGGSCLLLKPFSNEIRIFQAFLR